jgi:hypothetical protein
MRKALIAAIVATALFAVGAFAATFAVDSEDIASGSDPVGRCATNVDITFDDDLPAETGGTWEVEGATATFYNLAGEIRTAATACLPFTADLSIDLDTTGDGAADGDPVVVRNADIVTSGDDVIAVFPLGSITANQVVNASVLVDGAFLP